MRITSPQFYASLIFTSVFLAGYVPPLAISQITMNTTANLTLNERNVLLLHLFSGAVSNISLEGFEPGKKDASATLVAATYLSPPVWPVAMNGPFITISFANSISQAKSEFQYLLGGSQMAVPRPVTKKGFDEAAVSQLYFIGRCGNSILTILLVSRSKENLSQAMADLLSSAFVRNIAADPSLMKEISSQGRYVTPPAGPSETSQPATK